MNLPEPTAWVHKNDFGRLMFSSSPTVPPWSFPVFTEAQMREALARQEAVMRQALAEMQRAEAIMLRECGIGVVDRLAIKALEDALGSSA